MKGLMFYRLRHLHHLHPEIRNIIETLIHRNQMNQLNKEFHHIYRFYDVEYDYTCPQFLGRCITNYKNVKIYWLDGKCHRNLNEGPAIKWVNGNKGWYVEGKCCGIGEYYN